MHFLVHQDMIERPTNSVERWLIWSKAALTDRHKNTYAAQLQWKGPVPPSNEAEQQRRHGRLMYSDTIIEAPTVPETLLEQWTIISISPACTFSPHAAAGCRGNYWDPLAMLQRVQHCLDVDLVRSITGRGSGQAEWWDIWSAQPLQRLYLHVREMATTSSHYQTPDRE